ncbi:MAG: rod shape-determining protein RodA [Candidatus Paceibacterota bacterium]|jgi:rod shape determining protein RodA
MQIKAFLRGIDWVLFFATLPIVGAGILTMNAFTGQNYFAIRQIIWLLASIFVFFIATRIDWRFAKRPRILVASYLFLNLLLLGLFAAAKIKGASSWFHFGIFAIEPSEFVKILLIIILAKYFHRRHIEIANFKHIFISGLYAAVPLVLVLLQPDFGSAIIILIIWFGMTMVSGISKKHFFTLIGSGILAFLLLWLFIFKPYQKNRILNFIDPLRDVRGSGYNAFQSQIAVGSGQILGKGVGFGTQSRLKFLPEYQTDFIFAAFAEEWGFMGVSLLLICYGIIAWRIIANAFVSGTNFETLFCAGYGIFIMAHFAINAGMNVGLLPVTGITLPFMSYGGTHLIVEYLGLGMIMSMRRYARATHRDNMKNEFLGI